MVILTEHDRVGLGFSITGLALVLPVCFMFKHYFRSLDYIQLSYLFAAILGFSSNTFSRDLDDSWVNFSNNFFSFCTTGDVVCTLGFQLSFTICLLGAILILLLIVSI